MKKTIIITKQHTNTRYGNMYEGKVLTGVPAAIAKHMVECKVAKYQGKKSEAEKVEEKEDSTKNAAPAVEDKTPAAADEKKETKVKK